MQLDTEVKVIKVDTKRENYTVRIYKDYEYLIDRPISTQAEVYYNTKFYPVQITDMYFTIEWVNDLPTVFLDVEFYNVKKEKLPIEFYLRFFLLTEEDKDRVSDVFEITL